MLSVTLISPAFQLSRRQPYNISCVCTAFDSKKKQVALPIFNIVWGHWDVWFDWFSPLLAHGQYIRLFVCVCVCTQPQSPAQCHTWDWFDSNWKLLLWCKKLPTYLASQCFHCSCWFKMFSLDIMKSLNSIQCKPLIVTKRHLLEEFIYMKIFLGVCS